MILRRARTFVLSKSPSAYVDPLDIVFNGIFTRPSSLRCQILRSVEEHCWRWRESPCPLELANLGFSVIVLYCARMFTYWFVDHHVPKPDYSVVSVHRHTASNADQQTELEIGECHPHLGDDRSRGVVAWLMKSGDDNIMPG